MCDLNSFYVPTANRMSSDPRLFHSGDYFHLNESEPARTVITQSVDAAVVAWTVLPGQSIPAHHHPQGQDSFVILSGAGSYQIDAAGTLVSVKVNEYILFPYFQL
jgi:quercetin dioxygenase-like cupin family protein